MPPHQSAPGVDTAVDRDSPSAWRRLLARHLDHILAEDADLLTRWRARLTAVFLSASATFGLIPAISAIVVLARQGAWTMAAVDAALMAMVFVLLLSRRVPNSWRSGFLTFATWLIGVTGIITLGPFSTALGWMFMSVFLAAFLLDTKATVLVVVTIVCVLAGVAYGVANEMLEWARGDETAFSRWVLMAVDFAFLISLFAATNRLIMRLLEREDEARRLAEQQLAEGRRNEALGTLASGIAHDFNNLLVPVLSNVEMVHDSLPENSIERAALQDAQRSAERARDLVQRILSFGRGVDANRCVLNLAGVSEDVVRMTRTTLPSHVSLSLHKLTDAPVRASVAEVHQIVHNLVTNAVHAVTEAGEVLVDIARTDIGGKPWIRLAVKDTGVGMDAATRERIFDPYFSTREVGRGTGLGLPIVQSLVTSLGGSVVVQSEQGRGSTFTVLLPQAIKPHETSLTSAPPIASATQWVPSGPLKDSSARSTRVLLVDDEVTVQKVTARLLSLLGCEVVLASSTIEALRLLSTGSESFDLLMTDYRMPGRSGAELIADALEMHPDLRVVLVSGNIESATVPGTLAAQVVLLRKPFSRTELTNALSSALA